MINKGFNYTLEKEQIKEYLKLSPEEKLLWLEDIFLFSELALSQKAKKVRNYFRKNDKIIIKQKISNS